MMKPLPLVFACLAAFALPAQADQQKDLAQKRLVKLQKALERMATARNVAYQTRYDTKDAARDDMYKRMGREGPKTVPQVMNGQLVGDLLFHVVGKKQQIATRGRMRIARSDGEWQPTLGRFEDDSPSPFLFDPERFCRVLSAGKLAIARHTVGMFENKPVEIYTLKFSGKDAAALGRAGVFPDGLRNSTPTISFARAGGAAFAVRIGGARGGGKMEQDVDIALYLEPGKGDLLHAKVRYYKTSPMAGRMRAALLRGVGPVDDAEEEEEEEKEKDAKPKKLEFKDGLPVRAVEGKVLTKFDITFTSHGEAKGPVLDARAKTLLGIEK